jgi:hypothetical protein
MPEQGPDAAFEGEDEAVAADGLESGAESVGE